MKKAPRILVISHNVFSQSTAMGKTLSSMLSCVPPENLAQLYFHSEVPTVDVCKNYLRIRDQDVLRAIVTRHAKCAIFGEKDIQHDAVNPRTDKGTAAKIYQFSRKRTPWIYNLRNLMWKMGKWNSKTLKAWLKDFSPDLIFFASGDYAFSYRIAYSISLQLQIPIVLWCCDDFYLSKRYANTIGGRYYHHNLMKWVERLSGRTRSVVVISEQMKRDYSHIFNQPINVVRISAPENRMAKPLAERRGIVFAGGLGVNRIYPLVELGRQLRTAKLPGYEYIDVYSNEKNPKVLEQLTEENGIRFHGGAAAGHIPTILGEAKFALHVEAFDDNTKERTRYSLSTKIAEMLRSRTCIIAYGPSDIASIEYLAENKAALILGAPQEITEGITALDTGPQIYEEIINNAERLAQKNHSKDRNDALMSEILFSTKKEG